MSAIFPPRTLRAAPPAAPVSRETLDVARQQVRRLLESSDAFNSLSPDKRESLAKGMVQIATYLTEPDGVRLKPEQQSPQVRALAGESYVARNQAGNNTDEEGKFTAQGAREGAAVAGALLEAVNFTDFCAGLINGVFHSIVQSSIEQMEAYAKLVADVSKSLNQFRDDNTTQNQGRDHLVEQFPDVFQLSMDTGEFSFGDEAAPAGPRVTVREGVDQKSAVAKINESLPLDKPIERLDDELVEALLVPAARTQLATSRQQLLATMVMLGINRIVVTDGQALGQGHVRLQGARQHAVPPQRAEVRLRQEPAQHDRRGHQRAKQQRVQPGFHTLRRRRLRHRRPRCQLLHPRAPTRTPRSRC